jgi:hypothetical protein
LINKVSFGQNVFEEGRKETEACLKRNEMRSMIKTMIIRPCILLFLLLFFFHSYSQKFFEPFPKDTSTAIPKNSAFTEVLGHGRSLISVNYERIFKFPNKHFLYTFRTGIGYIPGETIHQKSYRGTLTIPVVASFLAGGKHHYAQLGLGYSHSFGDPFIDSTFNPPHINQKHEPGYSISLGYRYMGLNVVVAGYPMLLWTNNPNNRYSVGFGFSAGAYF